MTFFTNKINKLDVTYKKPFVIFEKKNFFKKSDYQKLFDNFPDKKFFVKKDKKGGKLSFSNKDKIFYEFLKKNKIWSKFYKEINSSFFLNKFLDLINKDLRNIEQRKNQKKYVFFNNDENKSILLKLKKKITKYFVTPVRIGMQFSIIKSGNYIPPHCDTTNKLLSLMIYFPSSEKKLQNKEILIGTNFFKKKDSLKSELFDGWNNTLMSKKDTKIFLKNYELFYKSKFEKNKIVGFIKNEKSWHNVDKFNLTKNYLRKSVNINLFLD